MAVLNVVCVQHGNYQGRGALYVNRLYRMVSRHLRDFRFLCYTDNASGLDEGIISRETAPLPSQLKGWWHKLFCFADGQFRQGERVLYLDLDTLITGDLSDIARYNGAFAMLTDFYHPAQLASGVMAWRGGFGSHIWREWLEWGKPTPWRGDQWWIARQVPNADRLQDLFPRQIVSFKEHAFGGVPEGARIVCFHGEPRPHECEGWVTEVWQEENA